MKKYQNKSNPFYCISTKNRIFFRFFIMIVLWICFIPLSNAQTTVTIFSSADNSPSQEGGTTKNYGSCDRVYLTGSSGAVSRGLFKFDLSSIPAGATITSATLNLYRILGTGSGNVNVHRITNNWTEGTELCVGTAGIVSNWDQRISGTNWTNAGGDYNATIEATNNCTTNATTYSWNIQNLIQGWISGSNPNYGLLIKQADETTYNQMTFATREYTGTANDARLVITYTTATTGILVSSNAFGFLNNSSSTTISYNNASGLNQILMVGVSAQQPGASISSITFNGLALNKLGSKANSNQTRVEIWYLKSPPIGTYNLIITNSGSDNAVFGATTFSGVNQTNTFGTFVSATGNSTTASISASSSSNELIYSIVAFNNGATNLTQGSGQIEYWDQTVNSSVAGSASSLVGATTVTPSWSSTSAPWSIAAVALKPVLTTFSPLVNNTNSLFPYYRYTHTGWAGGPQDFPYYNFTYTISAGTGVASSLVGAEMMGFCVNTLFADPYDNYTPDNFTVNDPSYLSYNPGGSTDYWTINRTIKFNAIKDILYTYKSQLLSLSKSSQSYADLVTAIGMMTSEIIMDYDGTLSSINLTTGNSIITNAGVAITSGNPYTIFNTIKNTIIGTGVGSNFTVYVSSDVDSYPQDMISFPTSSSNENTLWLKANAGTSSTTNGSTVTSWADQSSYGNNATTTSNTGTNWVNAGNNPPIFQSGSSAGALNFNPTLNFSGGKSLDGNGGLGTYQVLAVFNNVASGTADVIGYDDPSGNGGGGESGLWFDPTYMYHAIRNTSAGNNQQISSTSGLGTPSVTAIVDMQHITASSGSFWINGANVTGSLLPNGTPPSPFVGKYRLGKSSNNQFASSPTIAEIISFNRVLTTNERQIANSYLGLKYGITLNQTNPQNYIASDGSTIYWNATTNSAYKNNITGIVRDDLSLLNQKQSKSTNTGLQVVIGNNNTISADNISNPNNFSSDKSALVWGDNAGSVTAWTTTGAPTSRQIVARTWKIQETGTVGSVKVQIADNSGSNGLPSENTAIYLLVDADGNFSAGATEYTMTLNGTNWEANVNLSNGQFFTFATEILNTCTGYANSVTSQTGITNPNNALGVSDGYGAELWDLNDQLILDLTGGDLISSGSLLNIVWRRAAGTSLDPTIKVEISSDNSNWTNINTFTISSLSYTTQSITLNINTRYIRFTDTDAYNLDLDAINFDIPTPTITSTTPASRPGSGSVVLGATSSAGTINWYASPTGGSSLGTGTSFTTPSISTTTTYYVDATLNGCTSNSRTAINATITSSIILTSLNTNVLCYGASTGAIDLSVAGGVSPYTYNWTASNGGLVPSGQTALQDLTAIKAGTYKVVVTDVTSKTTSTTITITQPVALSISKITTPVYPSGAINGAIDISVTGGTAPYTYLWTPGGFTTQDVSGLAVNTYTVTVTDACSATNTTSNIVGVSANPIKQLYLSDPLQALDRIDPVVTADATLAQSTALSTSNPTTTFTQLPSLCSSLLLPAGNTVNAKLYLSNISGSTSSITTASTSSSFASSVAIGSTLTFSHTPGTGSNSLLLVAISVGNTDVNDEAAPGTITGVTFGGTSMTLVSSVYSGYAVRSYIYQLINPSANPSANVVITLGTKASGIIASATTFNGVNQTSPLGTPATFVANGTDYFVTGTMASASDELVFSTAAFDEYTGVQQGITTEPGQTELWNKSGFNWVSGASSIIAGASSLTLKYNALDYEDGCMTAVSIKPSLNTGTMPLNPAITAALKYGSNNIITLTNPTYNSSNNLLSFSGTLGTATTIPSGEAISLEITTAQPGVSFKIDYDSQTKPSKIELFTPTVIDISSYAAYDAAYPNGNIISNGVAPGTTVYLRSIVTDPFGYSDITGQNITITPQGNTVTATSVSASGCSRTYEYVWNTTGLTYGNYSVPATAKEGFENLVTDIQPLTFVFCNPITTPVFTSGTNSSRCQSSGSVTYTATSNNSTGITYSLDSTSINNGNSINGLTGQVTFVAGWYGTSIITATANGCGGPKTSIHTVTITSTVGNPIFNSGITSQRCKAAGAVTYTATANNSTGITYTLDANSLSAGNTINSSTGIVNYIANWSGTSTITASAAGCNGPAIATHTEVTKAINAIDDAITGNQGNPILLNVLSNDLCDINPTSLSIQSQPQNGMLQIGTNGQITYLPNGSFYGTDQFIYRVCSNGSPAVCDDAVVIITVNQTFNDPCAEATQAKTYYMPFPENTNQFRKALWSAASVSNLTNNARTILSIKTPYPNVIMTYDHWEDGYEADITLPSQTTTLIWGDGNLNNGIAPGYPNDIIPAGGYIIIDNQFIYNPRNTSEIAFDGKDKMYTTADVAISTIKGDAGASGSTPIFAVQNIKTNVYDISRFGKLFVIPFGENITLGSTGAFKYTGIFIRAATSGTSVNLDYNGDGTVDITQTLNEGEVYFYDGTASTPGVSGNINQSNDIKAGGTVTSNYPVGIDLIFGGIDNYGTRNLALLPGQFYGNTYYSPVHTTLSSAPVYAFFTNTLPTPITINWTAGTTPTQTTGSVVVPANGNNYLDLSNTAGYKFQSSGGEAFSAVAIIDADASGSTYDWAFNMIDANRLTTYTSVAWAPGSNNSTGNYNPVWVTPESNTTIYIKFNGNMVTTTPTMSPCNLPYDIALPLNALQSYRIFDTDNDQTGLSVYTCDGTKIAAVWGQDPNAGNPTPTSSPAQDVGYVMQPRCLQQNVFATDDIEYTGINTPIIIENLANDFGFLCTLNPSSLNTNGLLQPSNGNIVINADGTITYTPNSTFNGTDYFEYRVYSIEYPGISDVAKVTVKVTDCGALSTENLITGKVFIEQLPDDGAYNAGTEAMAQKIKVDLYIDANCNGTLDAGENIAQSTLSDLSGNYEFHTQNGNNAKDDFDPTASFSGNEGGVNWSSNWVEQADDLNLTTGDVRILADNVTSASGNAIRIAGATNGISRSLAFSNATSATLRFSFRRQGMDNEGEALEVKMNGTTIYTIQDGDFNGGTDVNYSEVTIPLTSFNANSTNTILFVTNGTPATDDYFWIDNVELIYFKQSICYIIKEDPTNTNGNYTASLLNTQTASFTNIGGCDKNNYLGVKVNLIASDDAINTAVDIPLVINVLENDVVGKPNPATLTTAGMTNLPANGSIIVNSDGTITYTPNAGFTGTDDFEYKVCSSEDPSVCDIALVTVTVSCVSTPGINVINGIVYNDINNNGILESTDTKKSGVVVNLFRDTNGDGILNSGEPLLDNKTTDNLGKYQFDILPPTTTKTYLDQFNSNTTATQSNGTTSWTTNSWNEIGETNAFATSDITITSANGLRITTATAGTVKGAYRTANLSTAINATLSVKYTETGLDLEVGDYVDLEIATSANPGSWSLLKRFTGADGNQTGTFSATITSFISATTTIRFVTSGSSTMGSGDIVDFDNIQLSYNVPTAAKYIVQLAQPIQTGYTLTTPTPNPTGIHTASFTGAGAGICQKNFGLSATDLSVTKTSNKTNPYVGTNLTFTIVAKNNGPCNASGVVVNDAIPTGYTLVSATPSTGTWTSPNWTIGNLVNGASATLTITVTVKPSGIYANTASISGSQTDPIPGNNTSTSTPIPVTALSASITAQTNINCNGQSNGTATVTATGGTTPYLYSWNTSPVKTTATATGLAAGIYIVTVTDNLGYTATASVTLTQPALLTASSTITNSSCGLTNNGSVNLTISGGTSPYTFLWSNGATTEDISNLQQNNYTVNITDSKGCTYSSTYTILAGDCQPIAVNDINSTLQNTPLNSTVQTNDTPSGDGGNKWTLIGANGGATHGTVTMNTSGNYSYTPTGFYIGTDVFNYNVCDADGDCSSATVTITINPASFCLNAKVLLQGPYDVSNHLMWDSLRVRNFIPATQPYSSSPYNTSFTHVGGGGNEFIANPSVVFGVTGANAIVDWVFIELRDKNNNKLVKYTRSALLQRDGDIVDVDGVSPICFSGLSDNQFYIVIRHRNHLGVMTANTKTLLSTGTVVDFRNGLEAEFNFGTSHPLAGTAFNFTGLSQSTTSDSKRAMWYGDANNDHKVKYEAPEDDQSSILMNVFTNTGNTSFQSGFDFALNYYNGDINLSGKSKYEAPNDDQSLILLQILSYPLNSSYQSAFDFIYEQIPY